MLLSKALGLKGFNMSKQNLPNLKDHTIRKLKEVRAIYISLKEQHCSKNVLKFWGNKCIKLRQLLEEINKKTNSK